MIYGPEQTAANVGSHVFQSALDGGKLSLFVIRIRHNADRAPGKRRLDMPGVGADHYHGFRKA